MSSVLHSTYTPYITITDFHHDFNALLHLHSIHHNHRLPPRFQCFTPPTLHTSQSQTSTTISMLYSTYTPYITITDFHHDFNALLHLHSIHHNHRLPSRFQCFTPPTPHTSQSQTSTTISMLYSTYTPYITITDFHHDFYALLHLHPYITITDFHHDFYALLHLHPIHHNHRLPSRFLCFTPPTLHTSQSQTSITISMLYSTYTPYSTSTDWYHSFSALSYLLSIHHNHRFVSRLQCFVLPTLHASQSHTCIINSQSQYFVLPTLHTS